MRAIISIQKHLTISIMKLLTRNNMHMNANLFKVGPSSNNDYYRFTMFIKFIF